VRVFPLKKSKCGKYDGCENLEGIIENESKLND